MNFFIGLVVTVLFTIAGSLIFGWAFMLLVGVIHHEWWPAVPTIGYGWAIIISFLIRLTMFEFEISRKSDQLRCLVPVGFNPQEPDCTTNQFGDKMEVLEIINRIRQLLKEIEDHEYQHKNGLDRIMNSIRHNVTKLGILTEEQYFEEFGNRQLHCMVQSLALCCVVQLIDWNKMLGVLQMLVLQIAIAVVSLILGYVIAGARIEMKHDCMPHSPEKCRFKDSEEW